MAKSKIIKDLANGIVDTQTALKRTKVLLQELNSEDILNWVNYEIAGYPNDEVPEYRVIPGQLYGSYFKGSMVSHMKYNYVPLPLGKMKEEDRKIFNSVKITEGIEAIRSMTQENQELSAVIPADLYPVIALANEDPYMIITSAYVKISMPQILSIFPKVESKLLDILSCLEKQFGNLDDLDIDVESKSDDELKQICQKLHIIIYNDNRVTVGNNNKIKDSKIACSIEE